MTDSVQVYKEKNLRTIFLVTLMAVMGVASITPAFPKISAELKISPQSVGLLIIFFTLPGVVLTPFFGVLADRYGRKKVLVPALLLFGISGTACAFVRDFDVLLALRFFQGIGGASLGSLNVTLIGDIYSGKRRAEAMGYNSSVLSIATATYPVVGGLLASAAWFYPFLLPAFAVPVAFIVLSSLENPEPQSLQNLKTYFRNIFTALNDRSAILYFAASLVTFIILYGAYLTYFPFLLSKNYDAAPYLIGIMMAVMSAVTALTSSRLGNLLKYGNERKLLTVSYLFYAAALLIIPLIPNIWLQVLPMIVFGIAHGMNIPVTQILLANIAPIEFRGAFMSFNGMVLRLGQTLGPLVVGFMFTFGGMAIAFAGAAALALVFFSILLIAARK